MIYCRDCAEEKNFKITVLETKGQCQFCGQNKNCTGLPGNNQPPRAITPIPLRLVNQAG